MWSVSAFVKLRQGLDVNLDSTFQTTSKALIRPVQFFFPHLGPLLQ